MSLIFIGDPHFQTENIADIEIFIKKMELLCEKIKPKIICVGGDLLHTHERLHTTPLNKAYEFILMLKNYAKTFVLVGNHDYINNQQFLTENHWMNAMKKWDNVVIVDNVIEEIYENKKLIFCPYVPVGRFIEALNTKENWLNANVIFAHQEFFGCKMGAIISKDGDKWNEDYPMVISGHIHSRQKPQKNIYYSGSSMQHAFGETENVIISVLNLETLEITEEDLNLPKKKILYKDFENINNFTLKKNNEDKIKISIQGTQEEFKSFKKTQKYKELINEGIKISFRPKAEAIKIDSKELKKDEGYFLDILNTLVMNENNKYLNNIYEKLIKK